ncbi:bestrophin-like domain [Flavobacterium subsaxonicum]|nr:hypothetical protein [Flavobacterium subsaxonicum]
MNTSVLYQTPTFVIVAILFVLMLLFNRIGFSIHKRQIAKNPESASDGLGPVEGSLLGLLALLLSFTFGMSASRSDARRQAIVQEANDIGTAVLRADLYPDSIRTALRADFKQYVEARIAYYQSGTDADKNQEAIKKAVKYSDKIWVAVVQQSQDKENTLRSQQMIPALNSMIDIVSTGDATKNATVPDSIFWFLFLLIITASLIVGYSNNGKKINHFIVSGFALMTVLTVFLIMDLDRPRRGIINTDASVQNIISLRDMFKE